MRTIHGINENQLINNLKTGDQTAFELLFHYYYPGLLIYSSQFTANREEAEEIVQDFFVRLWQNRQQISPSDSLKNYLFTSVRNSCLNYLKHKKIEERYLKDLNELSKIHLVYDPDFYIATELQEKIKNIIELLPEKCREIFILSSPIEIKYLPATINIANNKQTKSKIIFSKKLKTI